MSNVNATREEIVAAAHNFAESMNDQNAIEHHGIKGMKWGVRNSETLRKYGLLQGASKGKDAIGRAAGAIAKSIKRSGANIKKASAATVNSVKAKAASVQKQKIAELSEKKRQAEVDKEHRKELGMSKREFDKLREKTLKSHDPKVVAKGMHTLTDAELKAKIQRLETEGKVAKMATTRKQEQANARKAQFEAIKSSPIYDVVNVPLKNAAQALIFESVTKQGLKPILDQRMSTFANKSKRKFDIKNKQGNAWKEYQEERTAQATRDYERKLEKKQKQSEAKAEKKAAKYASDLTKQRHREEKVREVSGKLNRDINRFNKENSHFEQVLAQGRARNAQASLDAQANDLIDRFRAA